MLSNSRSFNDVSAKRNPSLEGIVNFLCEMMKDNMSALHDPRFSFYAYLDQKLRTPLPVAADSFLPSSAPTSAEPAQSPAGTPKFVASEDNTQAKTNYYTEPSIGMLSPQPKRNQGGDGPPIESISDPDRQEHTLEEDHTFEVPLVNGSIFQETEKPKTSQTPPMLPSHKPILPDAIPLQAESMPEIRSNPLSRATGGGKRIEPSGKRPVYYFDHVEHKGKDEGVYIYVTTTEPAKNIITTGGKEVEQKRAMRVSLPLPTPTKESPPKVTPAAAEGKLQRLAKITQEARRQIEEEKKYANFCTKVIKQLNNTATKNLKDILLVIIYAARLIPKMSNNNGSKVLKEYAKVLTDTLLQYLSTLSATLVIGKNAGVVRQIFRRCALLLKAERLFKESADNLNFIAAHLLSPPHQSELQQKIKEEQRRLRTEQKLRKVSKEISEGLKSAEWEGKHKESIEEWCGSRPVEDPIADIRKFMDKITDLSP